MKIRIIDNRKKEKYMLDDEYLNGMAKLCGWQGTIVYNSLCRHADKEQKCFPSIQLMADQHGVNRKTIIKGIDNLCERKVIKVKKTRSISGQWLNNSYILLDKTEWLYDLHSHSNTNTHVPKEDLADHVPLRDIPCPSQGPDHVPLKDTKETHKKETHIRKHITSERGSQRKDKTIINIIEAFKEVNPLNSSWYANTSQRKACQELSDTFGEAQVLKVISILPKTNTMAYIPKITTPCKLRDKWADLEAGLKSIQNKKVISKPKIIWS